MGAVEAAEGEGEGVFVLSYLAFYTIISTLTSRDEKCESERREDGAISLTEKRSRPADLQESFVIALVIQHLRKVHIYLPASI